jgi:hypothetical protein
MKMAVFWDVAQCSQIFTDVLEVLTASIIRAMSHHPGDGGISTSEMLVSIYQPTCRNIPEDGHLYVFGWLGYYKLT